MTTKPGSSITTQIVAVLLALIFIALGAVRFYNAEEVGKQFALWGYPSWFVLVVGAVEIAMGLLILYPRTSWIGAAVLAVLMVGAVATHLIHGQKTAALMPGLLCVSLMSLAYHRFPRRAVEAKA
jgi:uncharacterized membrane protein YphA (DoxX/SURF4 family)